MSGIYALVGKAPRVVKNAVVIDADAEPTGKPPRRRRPSVGGNARQAGRQPQQQQKQQPRSRRRPSADAAPARGKQAGAGSLVRGHSNGKGGEQVCRSGERAPRGREPRGRAPLVDRSDASNHHGAPQRGTERAGKPQLVRKQVMAGEDSLTSLVQQQPQPHAQPPPQQSGMSLHMSNSNTSAGVISSNAYANGSNQNCGNVMTGRSSTRIHAPPGGASSFRMGDLGGGTGRQGRRSSGSHGMGASTRRRSAAEEMAAQAKMQHMAASAPAQQALVRGGGYGGMDCGMSLHMSSNGGGGYGGGGFSNTSAGAISSNAYANGSNQNCGNVMTGRSSTRIHAPPGGASSFNFC